MHFPFNVRTKYWNGILKPSKVKNFFVLQKHLTSSSTKNNGIFHASNQIEQTNQFEQPITYIVHANNQVQRQLQVNEFEWK